MKVKYNKTIYYWVECPKCLGETGIENKNGIDLTGRKIKCENCGEKLKIIGSGEIIYK